MKYRDLNEDRHDAVHVKALIYGPSGTGKTTFGVTAPKPLILLNEPQARLSIVAAAKRLGVPVPPVLVMECVDDYRAVATALRGSKSKPFRVTLDGGEEIYCGEWPETVVLDSLTELADLIEADIKRQSPPRIAKDGLPEVSRRFWQEFKRRFIPLVKVFRDAPLHVLFLCLMDRRESGEDESKSLWVGPKLPMKSFPDVVMAAVNVVGVTYRTQANKADEDGKRALVYGVSTAGPRYLETKPLDPLQAEEVTDFSDWVRRINEDEEEGEEKEDG